MSVKVLLSISRTGLQRQGWLARKGVGGGKRGAGSAPVLQGGEGRGESESGKTSLAVRT